MSYICPLCNGLTSLQEVCPSCRNPLVDNGRLEDYAGPYSPYGSADQYQTRQLSLQNSCEHVAECFHCHEAYTYAVVLWENPGLL
ncbi:hypothetical protein DCC85_17845 [Paenibacillus sp. CAA11]|nr:hypothetical protein DCC85_17845 [Paenibacillus sp. CAA11]